jgi:hypothetical protein
MDDYVPMITVIKPTKCVGDLDRRNEMIISMSFLITFEAFSIFQAAVAVSKLGSIKIPNHHKPVRLVQNPAMH